MTPRKDADAETGKLISTDEARQGDKRHRVIRVLAVSLLLAAIALAALMMWAWRAAP